MFAPFRDPRKDPKRSTLSNEVRIQILRALARPSLQVPELKKKQKETPEMSATEAQLGLAHEFEFEFDLKFDDRVRVRVSSSSSSFRLQVSGFEFRVSFW